MAYQANGVTFDGTNDYLVRTPDLVGNADSKLWSGAFWAKRTRTGVTEGIYVSGGSPARALILFDAGSNDLILQGRNVSAGTVILQIQTVTAITDTNWHHFMFSVDLADTSKRHLYQDGVDDLQVNAYTNDTIDFTDASAHAIGANPAGAVKFAGDFADMWLEHGVYIDLSIEANRLKFRCANGGAPDLGSDGSKPTGTAPIMFFSGATADWHTNKGSGGGFTENGALTDAATDPAQCLEDLDPLWVAEGQQQPRFSKPEVVGY